MIYDRLGKLLFTIGERNKARFQAPFNPPPTLW